MRGRDCARNLNTPYVCARKHLHATMNCYNYLTIYMEACRGHTTKHCTSAYYRLMNVKPHKQPISSLRSRTDTAKVEQ